MRWDNTWARDLAWLSVPAEPVPVQAPRLLALNDELAVDLGFDPDELRGPAGLAWLAGNGLPAGAEPVSQGYAGHQFGYFSPMLGDGRAHVLGEVVDSAGCRRDIALKGSGRTPFSRGGDGRAAVGPVLREFLVSEAMHALGIPTTRTLAAVATGEAVLRERPMPGAVLTRVASSHLRIGTVELVRTRLNTEQLAALIDYVRVRHYPDVAPGDALGVLDGVVRRQADLVAAWMSVGFVHGVMNTDNMTLSGETIDFGPCAFLDGYQPEKWFSSIDSGGRYRYSAQPTIALWNLSRLAEAMLPLIDDDPDKAVTLATECLQPFGEHYHAARLARFRNKLGLRDAQSEDVALIDGLLTVMAAEDLDFTRTFRSLGGILGGDEDAVVDQVQDRTAWGDWLRRWFDRLGVPSSAGVRSQRGESISSASDLAARLDRVNPIYIPRNHLVEEALAAAPADLEPFNRLLDALRSPYVERPGRERFAESAPDDFQQSYVTFCGT